MWDPLYHELELLGVDGVLFKGVHLLIILPRIPGRELADHPHNYIGTRPNLRFDPPDGGSRVTSTFKVFYAIEKRGSGVSRNRLKRQARRVENASPTSSATFRRL